MTVHLIIQNGRNRGKKLAISKPELLIGRSEDCGLRLSSATVSAKHCRLLVKGNRCKIEDLSSENGTFVNGNQIDSRQELRQGDRILIGPLELLFTVSAASEAKRVINTQPSSRRQTKASDDDVASWLMEDSGEFPMAAGDSTITMAQPDTSDTNSGLESGTSPEQAQKRRNFDSLAEEAQDIINRHLAKLEQNE